MFEGGMFDHLLWSKISIDETHPREDLTQVLRFILNNY